MHDLFLAQKILDKVLLFARKNRFKNITQIIVELGKIEDHNEVISPINLRFNLSSLSRGTIIDGAEIVIKRLSRPNYIRIKEIRGVK